MLLAFLVCATLATTHALPTTSTLIVSRAPFAAVLTVKDVRAHSVVEVFLPYNLRHAVFARYPEATCTTTTRNVFAATSAEIASIRCTTGTGDLDRLQFDLNGTIVFEPVRFIVAVCAADVPQPSRCWTNELEWASPTAYDRIMSCQLVAFGVLIFWLLIALMLCGCMCKGRGVFSGTPPRRRGGRTLLSTSTDQYCDDDDEDTGGSSADEADGEGDSDDDQEKQRHQKRRRRT